MQYYLTIHPLQYYSARITLHHVSDGLVGTTTLGLKSLSLESSQMYSLPLSANKHSLIDSLLTYYNVQFDNIASIVALSVLSSEHLDLQAQSHNADNVLPFVHFHNNLQQFRCYQHAYTQYQVFPIHIMNNPQVSFAVVLENGVPISTALVRNQHLIKSDYAGLTNRVMWGATQ